jgi:hypothetical protein
MYNWYWDLQDKHEYNKLSPQEQEEEDDTWLLVPQDFGDKD